MDWLKVTQLSNDRARGCRHDFGCSRERTSRITFQVPEHLLPYSGLRAFKHPLGEGCALGLSLQLGS